MSPCHSRQAFQLAHPPVAPRSTGWRGQYYGLTTRRSLATTPMAPACALISATALACRFCKTKHTAAGRGRRGAWRYWPLLAVQPIRPSPMPRPAATRCLPPVAGMRRWPGRSFDIVIYEPPHRPAAFVRPTMYDRLTPFLLFAEQQGAARQTDGLGMLVEQAAESFLLWRGIKPRTLPLIAQIRAGLL